MSSLTHKGSSIFKEYEKEKISRRLQAHAQNIAPHSLVLLIAPMLGWGLKQFVNALPENCIVIPIEFDADVYEQIIQHHTNNGFGTPPHAPLLHKKSDIVCTLLTLIQTYAPRCCAIIYYTSYAYQYKQQACELQQQCEMSIQEFWRNHATTSVFGLHWLRNIWQNFSMTPSIPSITPKISGAVFAIGAGPSLSCEVLEFLVTHQHQYTIIAADTALPVLQRYNIVADMCVMLESQFYNMFDLLPVPHPRTIAISDITSFPSSHRVFSKSMFVSSQFTSLSFFKRNATVLPHSIPPLGSVGLVALYMAIVSQCDAVFLAGLDFSYYKGLSHCIHSPTYETWLNTTNRLIPWHQIHAHLQNTKLHTTFVPSRVCDSTLNLYCTQVERMLLPMAKKRNIPVYDTNAESIINAIQKISIKDIEYYNHSSNKKRMLLEQSSTLPPLNTLVLLQNELNMIEHTIPRIRMLHKEKTLPTKADREHGMDMMLFALPDNPYNIAHDPHYWEEYAIHQKLLLYAHKIKADITKAIKRYNILHAT